MPDKNGKYNKVVDYKTYEKDYVEELEKCLKGENADLAQKYIKDVIDSGHIKKIYDKRLKGYKDGTYGGFYLESEAYLHNLCFPDWD